MKNILLCISFSIALLITSGFTMDSCCDQRNLESTAKRYALTIIDGGQINELGIIKDLQFLSPAALGNSNFAKYVNEDSFAIISKQATTDLQKQVVSSFTKALNADNIKNDALLKIQLFMLLDKVIVDLEPLLPPSVYDNLQFKSFAENSLSKYQGMMLSLLTSGPNEK